MRNMFRAAVLALPLVGLGWTWHTTRQTAMDGVEWRVPVNGYDPRDLLRGHYIRYTYDWPEMTAAADNMPATGATDDANGALCLAGRAPDIRSVHRLRDGEGAKDCAGIVAASPFNDVQHSTTSGRLYVSESNARVMQSALADPKKRGILRFRLRKDGQITPIDLSFNAESTVSAAAPAR